MRDAGIVDQDGDGAECLLGRVEGARHGGAVEHVGLDRHRLAAVASILFLQILQPVGAPRHQRDRGAVLGQHARKARPSPLDAPVTSATRP